MLRIDKTPGISGKLTVAIVLINALHGKESIHEFRNSLRLLRINNLFFGNERHTLFGDF